MFWKISLFNLKPAAADDLCRYEAQGLPAYETYLNSIGQHYAGAYRVRSETRPGRVPASIQLDSTWAEVRLAESPDLQTALLAESAARRPAQIQAFLEGRLAFLEPSQRLSLWLAPMCLSPLTARPMPFEQRLLRIVLRYLPGSVTVEELGRFGQSVIAAYAAHMALGGWNHVGTYHAFGLPEYMYADTVDLIDAATPEEALANDAANPTTPDLEAIYAECDRYLDPSRERFVLWLTPQVSGPQARAGFLLA